MKQFISLLVSLSLVLALLAGCGSGQSASAPEEEAQEKTLSIVTTIFPEYDWVMNVLGDKADGADVTMLLDNGADLHSATCLSMWAANPMSGSMTFWPRPTIPTWLPLI